MELSGHAAQSDLVGRPVYDAGGRRLGRVVELRGRWQGDEVVVEELLIGTRGLLKRLRGPQPDARGIPWEAVLELGDTRIVVRA